MIPNAQTVRCKRTAVRKSTRRIGAYHSPPGSVNLHRQIFPGRRNRKPPEPASGPGGSATALSLVVILLGLQMCQLSAKNRRAAVALAESWTREIVQVHHPETNHE